MTDLIIALQRILVQLDLNPGEVEQQHIDAALTEIKRLQGIEGRLLEWYQGNGSLAIKAGIIAVLGYMPESEESNV